jgi:hypothetical protein
MTRQPPGRRGPGEEKLRATLRRHRDSGFSAGARKKDPAPYDSDWGWWIEKRLARLEKQIRWLVGLAAAALAAEAIRIALAAFGLSAGGTIP